MKFHPLQVPIWQVEEHFHHGCELFIASKVVLAVVHECGVVVPVLHGRREGGRDWLRECWHGNCYGYTLLYDKALGKHSVVTQVFMKLKDGEKALQGLELYIHAPR